MKGLTKGHYDIFINSDKMPSYDPVRSFFTDFKGEVTEGHIDELIACIQPYNKEVMDMFTKWLIGVPANLFSKMKNILVPVLYGGTNTGKTQFFMRLMPEELTRYSTIQNVHDELNKDASAKMTSNLIVFFDEFKFNKRTDAV